MSGETVRRYYVPLSLDSFPTDVVRAADYDAALARVNELEGALKSSIALLENDGCEYDDVRTYLEVARAALAKEGK